MADYAIPNDVHRLTERYHDIREMTPEQRNELHPEYLAKMKPRTPISKATCTKSRWHGCVVSSA